MSNHAVSVDRQQDIAIVTIARGSVNAINEGVVTALRETLRALERDAAVRAVILTGHGKFFSFGFDVPEFIAKPPSVFSRFLDAFTDLYRELFLFPKPVVAALNGHAIAAGCMLTLACDSVVMVSGKARIALNEIAFGSTVFAGSVEMLRFRTGSKNAMKILYSGAFYSAEEAKELDLIDRVTSPAHLIEASTRVAFDLGRKWPHAFASIKGLLRERVLPPRASEAASIEEFKRIWTSEQTWQNLPEIRIW